MCAWEKPKCSSFTAKLRRMVGDLRRKRKAIGAHRSAKINPFLSSHKPSQSPPPHHFTTTYPQLAPSSSPGTTHSHRTNIHPSPPAHILPQDSPSRCIRAPHIAEKEAPHPAPITPQASPSRSFRPPYIAENEVLLLSSSEKKALPSNPSPLSSPADLYLHRGQRLALRILSFALLCACFCIGKEVAFLVAVVAHVIVWLALTVGLLTKGSNVIVTNHIAPESCYQEEEDSIAAESGWSRPLGRSSTIPCCGGATFTRSLQLSRRSRKLHNSVQEEGGSGIAGDFDDFPAGKCAGISEPQRCKVSAKLKLQVFLLSAMCGLFYGRIVAVCMALCCILIHSTVESLFFNRP